VAETVRFEKLLHEAAADEIIFYDQNAHTSCAPG
jgi:hypothetical protein